MRHIWAIPGPLFLGCEYYADNNLNPTPPLAPELFPGIFVSGSSDAGLAAAKAIGAVAVKSPKAPEEEVAQNEGVGAGVRVGIIAREDGDEAWRIARERFPEDRRGQLTHQLAMKVSDSVWHGQLSDLADATAAATVRTGSCPSRTTRPCARTSWAATSGAATSWRATSAEGIGRSSSTFPPRRGDCTTRTRPSAEQ